MPSTPQQRLLFLQHKYPGILEDAENMNMEDFIQKHNFSVGYVGTLGDLFRGLFPEKNFLFHKRKHTKRKKGDDHARTLRRDTIEEKYPDILTFMQTMTNSDLAMKYGISRERVRQLRERFAILLPAVPAECSWTPEKIALLGTKPDTHVAKEIGVSYVSVLRKRRSLGISGYKGEGRYSRLEPYMDLIGKISDRKLSRMTGVHVQIIADYRDENGIPPFHLSPMCADFKRVNPDEVKQLFLAGASDEEVSESTGRALGVIKNMRLNMGLLRHRKTGKIYRRPDAD